MRISTAQYFDKSASGYSKAFSDTAKTQEQISSGSRIQSAADDPAGAAKLLQLQQQQSLLTQYSSNMTTVTNSLNSAESVLQNVTTALQRAQGLALEAGNGSLSDADRGSIAAEIDQIKENVYGLLNSKDAGGNYIFSGSKTSTPPYVRNSDGSFTYQGDQTQLSLQVSDTLSLATNDTGYSIFDQAINTSRTLATPIAPTTADDVVSVQSGRLSSLTAFDQSFTNGQPYTLEFSSSTQFTIKDKNGLDITSQTATNGAFDPTNDGGSTITLRGVEFDVNITLQDDTVSAASDAAVSGHQYSLSIKPDTMSTSRNPSNLSGAQVTGAVSSAADYNKAFPTSGTVIKFTTAPAYAVYAQPYTDSSKAIDTGTAAGSPLTLTSAGVTYTFSDAPQNGDQFVIQANSHKTQNVLDTLSQLSAALKSPVNTPTAQLALKDAVNNAIGNLASASEQIDMTRGKIGARGNSLDIQASENESLALVNKSTQSAIGDTDLSTASVTLTLQQTMLQAAQLAFAKISQLSLFNKI